MFECNRSGLHANCRGRQRREETPMKPAVARAGDPFKAEKVWGLIFVLPLALGFLVFNLYPLIASVFLSFTDYDIYRPPGFVGLKNYISLTHDARFWKVMKNTVVYMLGNVPLQIVFSLILASLLNNRIPGI